MSLVERARRYKAEHTGASTSYESDIPDSETVRPIRTEIGSEIAGRTSEHVRNVRRVLASGGNRADAYADQSIARLAVDTGIIRIVDGEIAIKGRDRVSPAILRLIEDYMPDVVRIVREMERAREYGFVYRREAVQPD